MCPEVRVEFRSVRSQVESEVRPTFREDRLDLLGPKDLIRKSTLRHSELRDLRHSIHSEGGEMSNSFIPNVP